MRRKLSQLLGTSISTSVVTKVKITTEDSRHLRAAEGWLELGDHVSAFNELEEMVASCRAHPDVLKLRWRIYAKAERWGNAYTIAEGLSRLVPDEAEPFIWSAYSARRMDGGGTLMALELLLDVVNDFPDEPVVPFNLACYNAGSEQAAGSPVLAGHRANRRGATWNRQTLETVRAHGAGFAGPSR